MQEITTTKRTLLWTIILLALGTFACAEPGAEEVSAEAPAAIEAVDPQVVIGTSLREDARHWRVVRHLAEVLNSEDADDFFALFSEALIERHKKQPLSLREIFNFASMQMAERGSIIRFHPFVLGEHEAPDSEFPFRGVVFYLDDDTPGFFGIALTDDDKIDSFSIFIREDLCEKDADCERPLIDLDQLPDGEG